MPQKLLLGPLLGIESDTLYTICFLTDRSVTQANEFVREYQAAAK